MANAVSPPAGTSPGPTDHSRCFQRKKLLKPKTGKTGEDTPCEVSLARLHRFKSMTRSSRAGGPLGANNLFAAPPLSEADYWNKAREAVQEDWRNFEFVGKGLQDNSRFALYALKVDYRAFQFCSHRLQTSWQLVKEALGIDGRVLEFINVNDQLRPEPTENDVPNEHRYRMPSALVDLRGEVRRHNENWKGAYSLAVRQNGLALQYVDPKEQTEDLVRDAVIQNGLALRYADKPFRKKLRIVLDAVRQNGLALLYAAPEMQKIREVVIEAVAQNPAALSYATEELQNDPSLKDVAARIKERRRDMKSEELYDYFRRVWIDREDSPALVIGYGEV